MSIAPLKHPLKEKKGLKTKKIRINYFYDWETGPDSNMAEFTGGLTDLFDIWGGNIVSHEIVDLDFYPERHDPGSVLNYFTSRKLEVPPSYNHEFFIKAGIYRILQIKLEVSIKTRNGLFVDLWDQTKDQNEFKNYIFERLRLCRTIEKKEYCSGFNINIIYIL